MTTALERFRGIFDWCREDKKAYRLTFKSVSGQRVLHDLGPFCRANETCVVAEDEHMTWVLEGRREVWLRIMDNLELSVDQLATLRSGQTFISEGEDNADRS